MRATMGDCEPGSLKAKCTKDGVGADRERAEGKVVMIDDSNTSSPTFRGVIGHDGIFSW